MSINLLYDPSTGLSNKYMYPNSRSYLSMRDGAVQRLAKGAIMARTIISSTPGPYAPGGPAPATSPFFPGSTTTAWIYKEFQFNPSEVDMNFAYAPVDTSGSVADGGNAPTNVGQGAMTVGINLLFHREQEVFAANRRMFIDGSPALDPGMAEVWRRIGVQKDIYDLFRVCLINSSDGVAGDAVLPDDMTMTALSKKAYDLSAAGSQMFSKAIVIKLNDDLAFWGNITSLDIAYKKFNFAMVPVWAEVQMSISCMNARPVNSLAQYADPGTGTSPAATSSSASAAATTTSSVAPASSADWAYSISNLNYG